MSKNEPPAFTRPSFAIFSSPPGRPGNATYAVVTGPPAHVAHSGRPGIARYERVLSVGEDFLTNHSPTTTHSLAERLFEIRLTGFERRRCRPTASKTMAKTKANVKETLKLPSIFRTKSNGEIVFYVRF